MKFKLTFIRNSRDKITPFYTRIIWALQFLIEVI